MNNLELFTEVQDTDDFEYDDIVHSVINSIKNNASDYCFTKRDMCDIIKSVVDNKLSMIYQEVLEKDGKLDYYKVIPAKFFVQNATTGDRERIPSYCCRAEDIPMEYQCVISRRGCGYILKQFNAPSRLSKLSSRERKTTKTS